MGKYGKKTVVTKDISEYMLGVMAPSGFGKTTLMYKVCEKLFGEDGYIILDTGTEDGVKAIAGAVAERVQTFNKLLDVVTDIVKNKDTDYPNLKVVVLDTLDACYEIAEEYTIKEWNAENANTQGFIKAKSINPVDGGFGKGMDRVNNTVKKIISKLNSVGVGVWWTAHVKEKDQVDLYTGKTFTSITANMPLKYFNSIKNSTHVVACGYYDREIEKVEVGKENPVTKKKKERDTLTDESRKIKFRDDMLVVDAKSRFESIIDEIPLDTDSFIRAITDAIAASGNKTAKTAPKTVKKATIDEATTKEEDVVENNILEEEEEVVVPTQEDGLSAEERKTFITDIRTKFKDLPVETKKQIREIRGESELEELTDEQILDIIAIMDSAIQ